MTVPELIELLTKIQEIDEENRNVLLSLNNILTEDIDSVEIDLSGPNLILKGIT